MSCVNTKSERFRQLAQKYDLSNGFLENILHEYYNESTYQLLFPTEESFIENRLSGLQNIVSSPAQVEIYDKYYSSPQVFTSLSHAQKYISEAKKYFTEESIVLVQKANGTYKVTIEKPIVKQSFNPELTRLSIQQMRQWLINSYLNSINWDNIDTSRVEGLKREVIHRKIGVNEVYRDVDASVMKDVQKRRDSGLYKTASYKEVRGTFHITYNPYTKEEYKEILKRRKIQEIKDFINLLSDEDVISQYQLFNEGEYLPNIVNADEYVEMINEFGLSQDNTDTFLYNFMRKVLGVNPKYKVDETTQDFAFRYMMFSPISPLSFEKLTKKIFGYYVQVRTDSREQFEKDINSALQEWRTRLADIISNPIDIDDVYQVRRNLESNIKILQRFINANLQINSFTEEERNIINKLISNMKSVTKKSIGFKIQKIKSQIESTDLAIQMKTYQRYAIILAAKNRLVALNTIGNLEDIVRQRLLREYDSRTVKDSTYQSTILPKMDLYNAIKRVIESKDSDKQLSPLFSDQEQRESSFNELSETILKQNPEFEQLLKLFHNANPNLKIFVGGSPEIVLSGYEAGKFHPRSNTLYLSNIADVYTTIHELAHSATFYGMSGSGEEQIEPFKKSIEKFMDYIRDYIRDNQMSPNLFSSTKFMGITMPADIYGFTNPSEFIAELYGNPRFQDLLAQIPAMEEKKFSSLLQEIWSEIVDFLNSLLGKNRVSETALDQAKQLGLACIQLQQNHIQDIYNQLQDLSDTEQRNIIKDNSQLNDTQKEYIQHSSRLLQQIENLIDNEVGLTSTDIQHIAEQVVFWISDAITDYQQNPEKVFQVFKNGQKPTQEELEKVRKMSRVELVKFIGAKNLILQCKLQVFTPSADGGIDGKNPNLNTRKLRKQAQLIFDNFEAVVQQASSIFATMENFTIDVMENYDITEDVAVNADVFNPEDSNDEDDINETKGDTQEHWQIESRTIDVINSMSQLVKRALSQCYLLQATDQVDAQGNPVVKNVLSSFGIKERVSARDATNSILRWTQGALDINQMVAMLKEKQKDNPWLSQLTDKLSDTTGQYSDLQSQFFSVFCKHFQSYSVVSRNEKGKLYCHEINEAPALREIIKGIEVQYKLGEHTLFTPEGINKQQFAELENTYNELKAMRETPLAQLDPHKVAELIGFAAANFGYYATEQDILGSLEQQEFTKMIDYLGYIMQSLRNELENRNYDPFKFDRESNPNGIKGNLSQFLRPLTEKLEDIAISSVFDSGKMYQSYVTPSFTTKLFNKIHSSDEEFTKFLQDEYGQYEWFKDPRYEENPLAGWMNAWLRDMAKMSQEERKEMFKHKVQLNFNKKNYMRGMSETEYTLSLIAEYFSQGVKDKKRSLAWYRVPMLSNKPSSEFILAPRYTGMNYKNSIVSGFKMIFNQEIQRIMTVQARAKDESIVKIKNFDKNGSKFCFLDFLNDYLTGSQKDSELGQFIQKKISGQELTFQEKQRLDALLSEVITQFMDQKADQVIAQWEKDGITDGLKKLDGFTDNVQSNRERLREFIWNDTFASMNIMQLTITDIAYYKDAEDLQKRLAQIHAPGVRGNIYVRDYNGHEVTDGTHRTFYLTDFDDFKSNIIENVREVFYRKLQVLANRLGEGYQNNSEYLAAKATYDSIIDQFNAINVADAQAYSSPTSYRKKALMFGKWDAAKEEAYQRLIKGDYSTRELQTVFGQPLKPFLYSNTTKDSGVLDAPMTQLKVPVQNKNSEYLLIMADAILQNEETGRPNLLRAIFQVMEESHRGTYDENGNYVPATDGIDTVQFESTVKSGLAGKIDIKQFQDVENGERLAKEEIERHIYSQWQDVENPDGTITRTHTREYNKNHIHETPYEDYCLQQEVPEHFIEHSQAHGSQIRYIIPSDLATVDDSGNQVYYTFNDPKLGQRRLTAQEFKEEYERTISENIQESINELSKELCIGEYYTSTKERNIAISKILKREIQSSPRYGIDLLMACEVDENGNFKIPLGDPIQSKRIEQLLNSIIKNRINKQKIAGGPVVQVTNFGTSQELQIRFKDKNGGMLLTHKEWDALETKQHDTYQDYIKENQGGIAYYEVFAPAYTRDLFKYFTDENGNIDIEAIEKTNPDLLKMVGYRIPTEDKYSMFPAKIVGFLPPEAGDGVMLPNDITLLTGSDFDVDKMYLMVKEFDFGRKPMKEIRQYLKDKLLSSLKGEERDKMNEEINSFLDQIVDMSSDEMVQQAKQNYPEIYKVYKQFAYQAVEPTEGRLYRNNKIVDMSYAVLTEETTADKMLNPGGFEQQKRMGYMVAAYKKPEVRKKYSWEDLEKLTTDELKKLCFVNKNLSFIDTHIQFYKQNSAAGMILGMFAVQKIAHAALESDGIILNLNGVKDFEKFTLCGKRFSDYIELDERYDTRGQFVGKTLGSLVASAADAVKDPVLNLMNINSNTASLLTTMIRFGMPFEDAALFISQNTVTELLHEFNKRQISGEFIRMNDLVQQRIDALEERYSFDGSTQINQEELTREELINGLRDDLSQEERDKIDYKVLKVYKSLALVANEIKGTTFATRLNSVSNAVGPLVVDNLILERKFDTFSQNMYIRRGDRIEELSLGEIFRMHPILGSFSDGVFIAKDILRDMPANSQNFRNILSVMMDENLGYDAIGKIIYNDRKLLGMLSDFYQSYMLVASGFADESQLAYYVSQFPSEVIKSDLKEKYKGNPFVDSMKYDTTKLPDGRLIPVLKIDITGLDTSQKEVLSSGWTDLYKQDPEIATKLFLYNFFRTGIGFSPKTFTSLTSTYIKSRLENNGVKYTSIFDGNVEINPMVVLKQFILNNLDNNKLCQKIELEKDELFQDGTVIYITGPKRIAEVGNKPFIKVTTQNGTRYYEKIDEDDNQVTFQEIKPLGGDGSYFEVSNDEITQPLIDSGELHENEDKGQQVNGDQHKTNEEESFDVLQDAISKKNYTFAALTVIMETRNYTQEQAQSALVQSKQKQKNKESLLNAIKKVFDKHQVFYSESEVESVYKEFC